MAGYMIATADGSVLTTEYEAREDAVIAASAMNLVVELGWHACDWAGRAVLESDVDVTVDEQYEALLDMGMGHDEAFDTVRAYC